MKIALQIEKTYNAERPYASDTRVDLTITDNRGAPPTVGALEASRKLTTEILRALR